MTAAEWIELLEAHAPKLRAAGVLALSVDGAAAQLAPAPPPPPSKEELAQQPTDSDPLNDSALYPSGIVPGYVYTEES